MKKNFTLFLSLLLLVTGSVWGQGSQNFDNAGLPTAYSDGNFSESGITWTYGHSRDEESFAIDGAGLMLRRASDSYLEWTVTTGGIGELAFDYRKAFTSTADRQLEVLVNGTQVSTTAVFGNSSGADTTVHSFSFSIDEAGPVIIRIKNVGNTNTNRQAIIDNISWTAYSAVTCTADPVITTAPSDQTVADGQDATFSVTATGASAYQWQVNDGSGWADINGATSATYTVTAAPLSMHNYEYRVNTICDTFSTTSSAAALLVTCTPATITTAPTGQAAVENGNATFSVVAAGSAPFTYQWQEDQGSGWSDIVGATTATYTVNGATLAMDGYEYQVIVNNVCGAAVTSTPVVLTVTTIPAGPCLTENFNTGVPTSYTSGDLLLPSGLWTGTNFIRNNTSGVISLQLQSATGSNIISPESAMGLTEINFSIGTTGSAGGNYQVNLSRDGGATWEAAPGSPFSTGQGLSATSVTIPPASPGQQEVSMFQIYRTAGTIIIDNIEVTCNAIPTPVTLRSFTAAKRETTTDLTWVTVKEQNNLGFEVERSTDSKTWNTLGFVVSLSNDGNSSEKIRYAYNDRQPESGTNFYRLKQIDLDGAFEYSAVRKVTFNEGTRTYYIYPNPARNTIKIDGLTGTEVIKVYNALGTLVKTVHASNATIEVADLAAGIYNVQILEANNITDHKLVIAK